MLQEELKGGKDIEYNIFTLRFKSEQLENMFIEYFWMKRYKYYWLWIILTIFTAIPLASLSTGYSLDGFSGIHVRAFSVTFLVIIGEFRKDIKPFAASMLTFFAVFGPVIEVFQAIKEIQSLTDCTSSAIHDDVRLKEICELRSFGYPSLKYTLENVRNVLFMAMIGIRWCSMAWGRILLGLVHCYAAHKEIQLNYLFGVILSVFLGQLSSLLVVYTIEKK